jgi:membrane-bound lytic murein transglycosylase D
LQAGQRLKVQRLGGSLPAVEDSVRASAELAITPTEIKRDTSVVQAAAPAPVDRGNKEARSYRVRQGDTLWSISKKFDGVTVADLMRHNNLSSSSKLTPGMVLKIQRG